MSNTSRAGRTITTTTTTTTTKTLKRRTPKRTGSRAGRGSSATRAGRAGATRADAPRYDSVTLRVHEVRCVKTTKEIDRDEIVIAAVKVEGALGGTKQKRKLAARVEKGESLSVGKFAKGDKQTYPKTRVLARYEAGGPIGSEPRSYVGALVLVEEDEGNIGQVVNETVKAVDKRVTSALSTAAATATTAALAGVASGAAIGSVVPLVGTAIGATVGAAVGAALGEIKAAHADDVFPIKMVDLELSRFPDEPGEVPGSRQTVTFRGFKGHYKATVSWAVR